MNRFFSFSRDRIFVRRGWAVARKQRQISATLGSLAWGLLLGLSVCAAGPPDTKALGLHAIQLHVDLSRASQRIFNVTESIPVRPGKLTLHYPKWIPGEHESSGPVANVAGLIIQADGQRLSWRRDLRDMYAVHLIVPDGADRLDLSFQFLPPQRSGRSGAGPSTSPDLAVLEFNQVLFYPAGLPVRAITVRPRVTLPEGWHFASALQLQGHEGDTLQFQALPLDELVDSPLLCGKYLNTVDLGHDQKAAGRLNIVGDRGADITPDKKQAEHLRELGAQLLLLFGRAQYSHYDFLLMLSDRAGHFGLEHRQSSDERLPADFLGNSSLFRVLAPLLPHEWIHSWNGKFRIPAAMWNADFNSRPQTDLLWVYEGLTDYWATVVSARSGLWTSDYFRAVLASTRNLMAFRSGRSWRSLQDTSDASPLAWEGSHGWNNWRRSADYYPEGQLLWLDVDTNLRELSNNHRSLDDFARAFFGSRADTNAVRTYQFKDIVDTLDAIQPYDWAGFLRQRLDYTGDNWPYHGLERSGWKLVYTDTPGDRDQDMQSLGYGINLAASLGFVVSASSRVRDVQWQGPASTAGLVPGMKVVAVNGKEFSIDTLTAAISAAADTKHDIVLLTQDQDVYRSLHITYHDGLRYPHLERIAGTQDLLSDIIKPRK